jgi:hypothetical protein
MERLSKYFVKSKITNVIMPILAVNKYHAKNKALSYFDNHELCELQVLYIKENEKN